jgi:hypothetical protein
VYASMMRDDEVDTFIQVRGCTDNLEEGSYSAGVGSAVLSGHHVPTRLAVDRPDATAITPGMSVFISLTKTSESLHVDEPLIDKHLLALRGSVAANYNFAAFKNRKNCFQISIQYLSMNVHTTSTIIEASFIETLGVIGGAISTLVAARSITMTLLDWFMRRRMEKHATSRKTNRMQSMTEMGSSASHALLLPQL